MTADLDQIEYVLEKDDFGTAKKKSKGTVDFATAEKKAKLKTLE